MVACGRMGLDKIGKPMKNMMKIMLKRAKLKLYKDSEEGRKALGMANCSINV